MDTPPRVNVRSAIHAARGGSHEQVGELLQLYANYLKILASTQIDRKLSARISPSDVVQETMLEAHRDFAAFRGESEQEFLAWLRRILVNNLARLVEMHILAAKRDVRREISLEDLGKALDRSAMRMEQVLAVEGSSPSKLARRHENCRILADRLAAMPPDYRDVLVLRHLEGLPFNDVAQRMGRSAGAVRMLWLRAIEQIRQGLTSEGLI